MRLQPYVNEAAALCETELLVATTPQTDGAIPLYGDSGGAGAGGGGGVGGVGVGGGGGGGGAGGAEGAWARRRVALLFGSEGSGLSAEALALADVRLSVPQAREQIHGSKQVLPTRLLSHPWLRLSAAQSATTQSLVLTMA